MFSFSSWHVSLNVIGVLNHGKVHSSSSNSKVCVEPSTNECRRFLEDELARRYREAAPATLALLQVGALC